MSKALYKGPTQNFFISGDLNIDTIEMNTYLAKVVSKLNNISANGLGEI